MVTVYYDINQYSIKRNTMKGEVIKSGYFYKESLGYYGHWIDSFHEERQG